jgi:alpha-beta hydrolase superfamily lysophospholipase
MIRAQQGVHGISTAMLVEAKPDLETTIARAGMALHVEHYRAHGPGRLALVMVHGFSSHCGLYRHVGAALASRGIAVTQFDCRGHGRSSGRRGHVDDFADYLDDLAAVVAWARARDPELAWALLAHSLGAAISLAFVLDPKRAERPDALVVLTPWLKLKMPVSAPKRLAAVAASRVYPTLTMPNGLRAEALSRNPLVLANFDKDPRVHHVATAGWFMATLRAQAHIRAHAGDLRVPTLLLLAGQDRIVANEASQAFARAAGSTVEVRTYASLYHEVFLEPEASIVVADVAAWLLGGRDARPR